VPKYPIEKVRKRLLKDSDDKHPESNALFDASKNSPERLLTVP
jgi:hypothetical protein